MRNPEVSSSSWPRFPSLDPRSLALLRVAVGLQLLLDLMQRLGHLEAHYGETGVLPRTTLLRTFWQPSWLSMGTVISGSLEWSLFFVLLLFLAACLTAGYYTRWATFLSWAGLVSLHNRNPAILDLGDAHFRWLLFGMVFLPCGAAWSIDARQGRPDLSPLTGAPYSDNLVRSPACLWLPLQMLLMVRALATSPEWLGLFQGGWLLPLMLTLPLGLLPGRWWDGPARQIADWLDTKVGASEGGDTFPIPPRHAVFTIQALVMLLVFGCALAQPKGQTLEGQAPALSNVLALFRMEPPGEQFPPGRVEGPFVLRAVRKDGTTFTRDQSREPSLDISDFRWRNYLSTLEHEKNPYLSYAYVRLSYDEHPNRVAFHRTLSGAGYLHKDGHHGQGEAA